MQIDGPEANRFSVWPFLLVFGLSLFVLVGQQLYDGRIFVDHDLYYSHDYFLSFSPVTADTRNPGEIGRTTVEFWRNCRAAGRLPNTMLYVAGRLRPMSLLLYRFFNLPFWLLAILAAYFLGRQLADRQAGWLCAALATTLPAFGASVRLFLPHFHAMVFLMWMLVFLVSVVRHPEKRWAYPLLGLSAGAAILSHPIGLLQTVPVFVLLLAFTAWKRQLAPLLGWLSALAIAALMNLSTWRVLSAYIDNKHTNFGAPSILDMLFQTGPTNAVDSLVWLGRILNENLLLPRFEILLAVTTAVAVGWWLLRSRKTSFVWLGLTILAALYFLLGVSQAFLTRNAGSYFDLIGAFSLAGFLPALGLYQMAGSHRHARLIRSLLIGAVLLIGAWQRADALRDVSAPPIANNSARTRVVPAPDWLRQTAGRLRAAGATGRVSLRMRAFKADSTGARTATDAVDLTGYLVAAGRLYSLQLIPTARTQGLLNPSAAGHRFKEAGELTYRVDLILFDQDTPARELARIVRQSRETDADVMPSWSYFRELAQSFDPPFPFMLALVSGSPPHLPKSE